MSMTPRNGMWLDTADFAEFQDAFLNDMLPDDELQRIRQYALETGCHMGVSNNPEADKLVRTVTFVVTEKCNLACTYCYETHKTNTRMTKETGKAAVDLLFDQEKINGFWDAAATPAVILDFIGGEPLMEIDLMDYIVEYFKFKAFELGHPWALNYMISISSNGTLYRAKKVQQFLNRNKGRVSMMISIDGDKDLHDSCRVFRNGKGSYDVVEKAVKQWVANECAHVSTKSTIAHENLKYQVESYKHLFENLHLGGVYGGFIYDKGWEHGDPAMGYQNLKALADWLLTGDNHKKYHLGDFQANIGTPRSDDRNFCGGSGAMLAVSAAGALSPCLRFMKYTLERQPEALIGDVDRGLERVDENPWLDNLTKLTMTGQSPPKCQECPVTTGCGGCTAYNYDYSGSAGIKATFNCKMHRARVLANVYYWNKMYRLYGVDRRFPLNMPLAWALEIIDEDEYWMLYDLANGKADTDGM